jgi:hypothetical protein
MLLILPMHKNLAIVLTKTLFIYVEGNLYFAYSLFFVLVYHF